jgi:uncharacterized membrane protein
VSSEPGGGWSAPPSPPRTNLARNILIGCGVVALLAVAVVAAFVVYVNRNPASMTDFMMKQIEKHYGPAVTEEQKRDLRNAYADFRKAVVERRVAPDSARKIQLNFSSASPELTAEQVRSLTASFREAAGVESSKPSTNSPPALSPSVTPAS